MTLHRVNSEAILAKLESKLPGQAAKHHRQGQSGHDVVEPFPKFHIPDEGIGSENAYEFINHSLQLDGIPTLNFASFVNTYIDDRALKLAVENITKNLADSSEYPALMEIHQRCVNIIGHLWNVPEHCHAVGTATTGSSEAIHLGGLAMKRRWEARQRANGRPTDKPNIIMASNAQVALEKFARYFDVQERIVPVTEKSQYCLDLAGIRERLDENTIGIFVIMGSTYTGHYEDVEGVSKILDQFEKETGHFVPIHVDGASGGFVAPFVQPELKWDFRLDRVLSISTSGHKFGLAVAGVGWILWKDQQYLPDNLVFVLKYLGGDEESYTLNFSRPGYQVIHQYYNLSSLGFNGYKKLHARSLTNARILSLFLESTGYYDVLSDVHRRKAIFGPGKGIEDSGCREEQYYNPGLPVVAFKFSKKFAEDYPEIPQSSISSLLRLKGYIVPNYPLPPSEDKVEVLRVVVRADMTIDLLDRFMEDVVNITEQLITASRDNRAGGKLSSDGVTHVRGLLEKIMLISGSQQLENEESWKVHGARC